MALVGIVSYVQTTLLLLNKPLMDGLQTAAERVQSGQADAACQRWFGDNTGPWKTQLHRTLRQLRSNINVRTIKVGFAPLDDRGANAAAWRNNGLAFSTPLGGAGTVDNMNLDVGFNSLPTYLPLNGGQVDASFYSQSKFETLVHELSHLFLNTKDVPTKWEPDGSVAKEAYGAKRAAKLAVADPAKAKRNAENWGIFVEAVGVHKSS